MAGGQARVWATCRSGPGLHPGYGLNRLIDAAAREPFSGIGKPEALRGELSGYGFRRIVLNGFTRVLGATRGAGKPHRMSKLSENKTFGRVWVFSYPCTRESPEKIINRPKPDDRTLRKRA